MKSRLATIFLIPCLFFFFQVKAQDDAFEIDYNAAASAYQKQDYQSAQSLYEKLLLAQPKNAFLHYNLGNVFYQTNRFAQARVEYEKSLQTLPRFSPNHNNLTKTLEALELTQTQESFFSFDSIFFFWLKWINALESQWIAMVFLFVFMFWVILQVLQKKKIYSLRSLLVFLICFYAITGYHMKSLQVESGRYGVVLEKGLNAQSSYLEKSRTVFELKYGQKVEVIDQQSFSESERWLKIRTNFGQTGWVLVNTIGLI